MNGLPDYHLDVSLLREFPPGQYILLHMVKKIASSLRISTDDAFIALKFMLATKSIEVDLTSDIVSNGCIVVLRNSACDMGLAYENN